MAVLALPPVHSGGPLKPGTPSPGGTHNCLASASAELAIRLMRAAGQSATRLPLSLRDENLDIEISLDRGDVTDDAALMACDSGLILDSHVEVLLSAVYHRRCRKGGRERGVAAGRIAIAGSADRLLVTG